MRRDQQQPVATDRGAGPDKDVAQGAACLYLDVRGCGELSEIDQRYLTYLGTALPFAQERPLASPRDSRVR